MLRDVIAIIYMYRGSIPPKKLEVLESFIKNESFSNFFKTLQSMNKAIEVIEWLFTKT